jgi:murein L,D-transpeptidase YcbB/YkuD
MAQKLGNQNSLLEDTKRLKFFGYSFSAISFVVFAYILLFPVEKELKQQAIYWFTSSFVVAIIPNVKQFRIKDIEVQLQEISQKIEDNKNLIEQKNEELEESLFLSLESVRENEETLPEGYRSKRELKYKRYAERLKKLTPKEKLKEQKKYTQLHLIKKDMDISDLKKMLQNTGFYRGEIDEVFDEQLAQSISDFQEKYGVTPIDGTVGSKTLSKLSEVIKQK